MNARTLAALLVALVVGLAFGYVVRGPSTDQQPERSTGLSAIELPLELEERLTRIEQLLQRSSLAGSEPTTRAPLDEPLADHTDLVAELRALIAEERATRLASEPHGHHSEVARWKELELSRRPINTAALIALADEWHANERQLPPRYFTHDLADVVAEFGWPTDLSRHTDGNVFLYYEVEFNVSWAPRPVTRVYVHVVNGQFVEFTLP